MSGIILLLTHRAAGSAQRHPARWTGRSGRRTAGGTEQNEMLSKSLLPREYHNEKPEIK